MTVEQFHPTGARWRWLAPVLVAGSAAAGFPEAVGAQQSEGPEPLSKADVIRLLTSDTYSESQVDRIVRRSCLSFRLTERDREDFRDLGASPSILAALTDCSEDTSLTVTASPDSLRATVGDTVFVTLLARRGDVPAEGIPLTIPEAIGASR